MPATKTAVSDTRQRGNPTPSKGRKQNRSLATQSRSRDLSAPPHSDSLKQPKIIYNNRYRTFF